MNKKNIKLDFLNIKIIRILYIIIMIIVILNISACHKKTNITIYEGPYTEDLGEQYVNEGRYNDALNYYETKLEQSIKKSGESSQNAAIIYNQIGEVYIYLGNRDEALKFLDKAIKINTKYNDELELAVNYNQIGKIYVSIGGDVNEGLSYFNKAEEIYKKYSMEKSLVMASVLNNKGRLYNKSGQYEKALDSYKSAIAIDQTNGQDKARLYIVIGQLYVNMKEFEKAEEQYYNAEKILKEESNEYLMGELYQEKGLLYDERGEYKKAISEYEKAIKIFELNREYELELALVYNNMGYAFIMNKELEKALDKLTMACQIIEKSSLVTDRKERSRNNYKHNLSQCYQGLTGDTSEENFEKWYQDKMSEGLKGVDYSQ